MVIESVRSKSGMIGYLEGSIKAAINYIKQNDDITNREQEVIDLLESTLKNSNDTWEKKVKYSDY